MLSGTVHPKRPTPAWWSRTSFAGRLPQSDRDALLRLGGRQEFPHNHRLLRQGEPGRHLLLLTSGRARVVVDDVRSIALRSSGDLLGELSYLDERPRSASVIAVGTVVARRITATAFDHFLRDHPTAIRPFAQVLADRLRAADKRTVAASHDVTTRVAATLCELAAADGDRLTVNVTQRELAQLVGASQVSVHRALRRLARDGLLDTRHGSVVIRDEVALAQVAEEDRNCIT
ncbi:Crp/Fnr family transcriptional regulator [Micromonospora coxensis]|uniref:cAMP-binding domain of CRP or a regulatory subunit of cAMP-dependent protein kinases n=1 Tax=Micromonospora coxensis TaxID=356852 RepID=A0A1C5JBQ6_9ACTN|nr:Crp/Fnr family transcriptional regulator [Micromonospora coxensis]SCG67968.1 cAMP-binding domain of CRP or a regulatory subunit of cAMP-dependent protein kinases [Micromonospora coxensis]